MFDFASVPDAAVARCLRMGRAAPDGAVAARLATLRAQAPQKCAARRVWKRCAGAAFAPRFKGDVFLLCATLGARFDAWQRRVAALSAADAFVVQAIGTAFLEAYLDACEAEMRGELAPGERLLPRVSPGYGDLPLTLNAALLAALDALRAAGVSETASGLLVPSKSVTAFVEVVAA